MTTGKQLVVDKEANRAADDRGPEAHAFVEYGVGVNTL